ncbi:DNA mismatch repair protein MutS [Roseiflexus castenholzii]|uniref:DNA mismatch repair protein MutS n=1 Tax=Roseiflexus castenholzii TaxID=120962 RepID=UPI003C7B7B6A
MTPAERRAFERQLQQEFPGLELHAWYRQYRSLKAAHPDAILLYRLGDFYETFDDDAKLVADLLEVTLTYKEFASQKGRDQKQRCPMAGIPYHAVEGYVARLVGAGYRVAIAEQMTETPSSRTDTRPRSIFAAGIEQTALTGGHKMVERKVVRIITPGTIIESGMLPAERNNYLAALIADHGRIGLAYADLSTGEFAAVEFSGERAAQQAQGELARLNPAEILVPDRADLRLPGLEPSSARLEQDLEFLTREERERVLPGERIARRVERENHARWAHGHVTAWSEQRWDLRNARDTLLHQFGVHSLAGFGLADRPLAIRAAGAIVQYARETQQGTVANLRAIRVYTPGDAMVLDPQTQRNLELLEGNSGTTRGSLIGVLDQTRTPMGARLLRRWISQPLCDLARLRARHDAVDHFVNDAILRASVRETLRRVGDMERVVNRIIQGSGVATPRDMARLRDALRVLPDLVAALGDWTPPQEDVDLSGMRAFQESAALAAAPLDGITPPDDDHTEQEPTTISLRAQREARRRVSARLTEDDLFDEEEEQENAGQPAPLPTTETVRAAGESARPSFEMPSLHGHGESPTLDACADILAFLETAIDDDPPALLGASNYLRAGDNGEPPRRVIRPGFEPEIDRVVAASRDAQRWISELEPKERERTGIKSLRVDYNRVFGYYIEVPKTYADQVPKHYIRKQTLTTGERYFTDELKRYEEIVEQAQQRLIDLERRAFARICETLAGAGVRLLRAARTIATIDVFAALAEAAVRGRYVRPELYDDTRLRIIGGRHPVVEQTLDETFIPNDIEMDTETRQICLITGPNMSGKSTVLRQVALIALMAQIGSFVPADAAEIGVVDRIFTRIGAQDDIATGRSTFMVEMTETAALLAQSTHRSLIILDEVGRGTSTYDGMAIAQAVIEYIHNEPRLGCRTLFATHYHELTDLERTLPRLQNYHMAATEQDGRVVFLHELRPGGADRSYGIHVAELAGIPQPVIRRATELLAELERRAPRSTPQPAPERTEERPAAGRPTARSHSAARGDPSRAPDGQLSLFDLTPGPVIEMLRRLDINQLTPLEALNKLYELQKLARIGGG